LRKLFLALVMISITGVLLSGSVESYPVSSEVFSTMVFVERGSFQIGDEFGDLREWFQPVHQVTFTYDFYIGKFEVTFDEYDRFCKETGRFEADDAGWGRGRKPVINVSWWDAIAYCNWLSDEEGLPRAYDDAGNFIDRNGAITMAPSEVLGYRLPTEAEWEYAARGGPHSSPFRYAGSDCVEEVAWYGGNSSGKTHEVGQKLPNVLGIYDMSGNVWEWCSDLFGAYTSEAKTDPYMNLFPSGGFRRAFRGGSWLEKAEGVRIAYRHRYMAWYGDVVIGFRIARTAAHTE